MERRENPRAEVALDCRIEEPATELRAAMVTENISRGGILMRWQVASAEWLQPGRLVTVEIQLPVHHAFGSKCMYCQASVVRVSRSSAGVLRIAVRVLHMDFRTCRVPEVVM